MNCTIVFSVIFQNQDKDRDIINAVNAAFLIGCGLSPTHIKDGMFRLQLKDCPIKKEYEEDSVEDYLFNFIVDMNNLLKLNPDFMDIHIKSLQEI